MKLRITSISVPGVGALINEVTTALEDRLQPLIREIDYGGKIELLTVFFIAVDADPVENERYCVANNGLSRFKDFVTGKMIQMLGLAVPVSPDLVTSTPKKSLSEVLENLLLAELKDPPYAMPLKFDRARLFSDLRAHIGSPGT